MIDLLKRTGVPTLEIWDYTTDPIDVCVGIDHRAAGFEIGQYVAGLGYRNPVFVGISKGQDQRADSRLAGVRDAFTQVDPDIQVPAKRPEALKSYHAGFDSTMKLLEAQRPDVIFYLNDHMAFGGMMAAQRYGLSVPDDIGIVGFNSLDITNVLPVALTTVSTPRRVMGIIGARALLARIHGVTQPPCQSKSSRARQHVNSCKLPALGAQKLSITYRVARNGKIPKDE